MEVILDRCAGLDVHKKSIAACVRLRQPNGTFTKQIKTFGTMTQNLLELSDWLAEYEVTDVAMESTGVLWKPVYNLLEGQFKILLCNAKHMKNVPGRKSDVKDSEWIARLLQHGLLNGSYIPRRAQRDLRDLTRNRAQLTSEKTRQINRVHKVLEDANIKLGAVASDIMGVSGRDMLRALIAGEHDPKKLAQLARRRMREKIAALELALEGRVSEHHRFLLKEHLDHVEYVEERIAQHDRRIERLMVSEELSPKSPDTDEDGEAEPPPPGSAVPFTKARGILVEMPGIDLCSAADILSEIGTEMRQFPTEQKLKSWARLCPGSNESAGKHKSTKTGKGNRWLRRTLSQCAWAASHTKDSYFAAKFKRLARKRGKKRAIIAVAADMLATIHHLLIYQNRYQDLGADYFDQLSSDQLVKYYKRRIESLNFEVTLTAKTEAA